MSAQAHTSDAQILDRRTLARDHRRLAALLRPGMAVLDVGCGTGAITAGIAEAVGPRGFVVGLDRDPALLRLARERHAGTPWLRFEEGDVLDLLEEAAFDIVTAARVLQWMDRPALGLTRMQAAVRPGGRVVVLDYSHARLVWEPEPPHAVRRFHDAFLAWRRANGWDNHLADHLPELLGAAGLEDVATSVEDEVALRGEPGFAGALAIWRRVMETQGPTMVAAWFLDGDDVAAALAAYRAWTRAEARLQRMVLRAAWGGRPGGTTR